MSFPPPVGASSPPSSGFPGTTSVLPAAQSAPAGGGVGDTLLSAAGSLSSSPAGLIQYVPGLNQLSASGDASDPRDYEPKNTPASAETGGNAAESAGKAGEGVAQGGEAASGAAEGGEAAAGAAEAGAEVADTAVDGAVMGTSLGLDATGIGAAVGVPLALGADIYSVAQGGKPSALAMALSPGLLVYGLIAGQHHSAVDYAGRMDASMQAKESDNAKSVTGDTKAQAQEKKDNQQLFVQANKVEDAIRKAALNVETDRTTPGDAGHLAGDEKKLKDEIVQMQAAAGADAQGNVDPNAQALVNKAITAGLLDVQIDNAEHLKNPGGQNRFFTNDGDTNGNIDPTAVSLGALAANSFQVTSGASTDPTKPSAAQVEAYLSQHDAADAFGTGKADNITDGTQYYSGFYDLRTASQGGQSGGAASAAAVSPVPGSVSAQSAVSTASAFPAVTVAPGSQTYSA